MILLPNLAHSEMSAALGIESAWARKKHRCALVKVNLQSLPVCTEQVSGRHTSDVQVIPLLKQDQGASLIRPIPIKSHTEEGYVRHVHPQPGIAGVCLPRACAHSVLGKCLFIYFTICAFSLLKSMILIDLILCCTGSPKPMELLQWLLDRVTSQL